eukprot:CAMPEP_0205891282 /NCGR_PEP_ID=MMETSP1083-20121108/22004_1 /ASSEMBLY_ACC=CAM_ASM_000430 /TAXON_ID=97485 /ORGANISM="Prymnesium parvum, Strain Texoma1" /LENGTH=34 /DNA_ID= /DNA_START= /DNA_END= /DNA_ORIENTATION=
MKRESQRAMVLMMGSAPSSSGAPSSARTREAGKA